MGAVSTSTYPKETSPIAWRDGSMRWSPSPERCRPHRANVGPRSLRIADLEPFARRWAVTDDHDREEALNRASKRDLRRLVDVVVPRLADIELSWMRQASLCPKR